MHDAFIKLMMEGTDSLEHNVQNFLDWCDKNSEGYVM
jgi:hypothetical protein